MVPEGTQNLLQQLGELGSCDLDPAASERIRNAAHAVFLSRVSQRPAPLPNWFQRWWPDTVQPAFVLAAGVCLLSWAVRTALMLHS
jgi:hypothetical protein